MGQNDLSEQDKRKMGCVVAIIVIAILAIIFFINPECYIRPSDLLNN